VNLPGLERLQRIAVIVSTVANVVHNAIGELRVELADLDPNSSNNIDFRHTDDGAGAHRTTLPCGHAVGWANANGDCTKLGCEYVNELDDPPRLNHNERVTP
jgi:hypothetical protein